MEENSLLELKNKINNILDRLPNSYSSYKRLNNHKEMLDDSELYLESSDHTIPL